MTQNKVEKKITIEVLGNIKPDRRGKEFFSIMYGEKKWLMCYIPSLRNSLKKGETYTVLTDGAREYEKLLDIISDETGVYVEPFRDDEPRKPYADVLKLEMPVMKMKSLPPTEMDLVEIRLDRIERKLDTLLDRDNPLLDG